MNTMTVSETLNKAADLIEERGWKSGGGWQYADQIFHDMPVCLEGGIQAVTGHRFGSMGCHVNYAEVETLRACPAYQAVSRYLDSHVLWDWNDAPGRTAAEVIEVLRAAALIEAAKEHAETRQAVSAS